MKSTYLLIAATIFSGCSQNAGEASIDTAQMQVAQALKDPASAQFRNSYRFHLFDEEIVCGELNAKNSYGGYIGFRHFRIGRVADGTFNNPTISDSEATSEVTMLTCGFMLSFSKRPGFSGSPSTEEQRVEYMEEFMPFMMRITADSMRKYRD